MICPLLIAQLHIYRCDPPTIPYLGIYLSDLTYIEEGTPNFSDKGLLNFSKMRMVGNFTSRVTEKFASFIKYLG